MTGPAGWFPGPNGISQLGVWDVPAGGARAAAVLIGTVGDEQLVLHRALRILAEDLLAQGIAVLRTDLPGTGDSGDPADGEDAVEGWLDGVAAAVDHARASGAQRIVVVGARLGAVLVSAALERAGGASLVVLWDPWPSGSAYLRHLRGLFMLAGFTADDAASGAVEGPGTFIDAATAAGLKRLRLAAVPTPTPTLVVARAGGARPPEVEAVLAAPGAELLESDELEALVDVSDIEARMPRATTAALARAVAAQLPDERSAVTPSLEPSHRPSAHDAASAVERFVRLGPRGMAAVVADPPTGRPRGTLLLAATAVGYRVGPGRTWVLLARDAARRGLRVVRFDYDDVGDSAHGTVPDGPRYYNDDRVRDVLEAAAAVQSWDDAPGPLLLAGHCSGSWASAMAARDLAPQALYLVNPLIWTTAPPELGPTVARSTVNPRSGAAVRLRRRILAHPSARSVAKTVWRGLVLVGAVQSADRLLSGMTRAGTRVTVMVGDAELERYDLHQRAGGAGRLARDPRVRLDVREHQDHSMKTRPVREHLLRSMPVWLTADLDALEAENLESGHSA